MTKDPSHTFSRSHCLSLCLSVFLSICLSVSPPVCLCLCVCLSVCLSVCLYIFQSIISSSSHRNLFHLLFSKILAYLLSILILILILSYIPSLSLPLGAVLSAVKCFINLTANHPDLQPQIILRAKAPLLTLITGTQTEVQYAMLKHLKLIFELPAARGIFDDGYRHFFVRYDEPSHVKHMKVDILPLISNNLNAREICAELIEVQIYILLHRII